MKQHLALLLQETLVRIGILFNLLLFINVILDTAGSQFNICSNNRT